MTAWTKTKDSFPEEDTMCIVMRIGYGMTTLYWNAHYKVWDNADMDDYCCDKDQVSHWIAYPEAPKDTA